MKRRRGRRVVVVVAKGEELRLGLRCGSTWREIATEGKGVFFFFVPVVWDWGLTSGTDRL